MCDWFAKLDPDLSSWRTSQRCLVGGFQPFLETWPRSGTMQSGTVYQLKPSAPTTGGTACSLLPTPAVAKFWSNRSPSPGAAVRLSLRGMAAHGQWPQLPNTAKRAQRCGASDALGTGRYVGVPASMTGMSSTAPQSPEVQLWPTPTAALSRSGGSDCAGVRKPANLADAVKTKKAEMGKDCSLAASNTPQRGSLNPQWVEWLMGFPIGWTAFDASVMP